MGTLINHCWGDGKQKYLLICADALTQRGDCALYPLCTNSYLIILSSFVDFWCVFSFLASWSPLNDGFVDNAVKHFLCLMGKKERKALPAV